MKQINNYISLKEINTYILEKLVLNKNSENEDIKDIVINIINKYLKEQENLNEDDYWITTKLYKGDYDIIVHFNPGVYSRAAIENVTHDLCEEFFTNKKKYKYVNGFYEEGNSRESSIITFTFMNQ